jgi:hypothetical protein
MTGRSPWRERPDFQLGWHGDVLYAEVKRFCEKKQDRLNEQAMSDAPDDFLVRLDDPKHTEVENRMGADCRCGHKESSCMDGRRRQYSRRRKR